jgi:membrane protein required for colicin V production
MTWVDLAVLGVLAISALLAFMRGLVREVLGIGAWVGAVAVAVLGLPYMRGLARSWIPNPEWVDPASFVVLFLITLIILSIIAHIIGSSVRRSSLGGVDRTLGLVFGLARGAALIIVAYIIAGMVVPQDHWPEPVLNARALSPTYDGAAWVVNQLPAEYRPHVRPPPIGRETTAEALLHATPQGRATGKPSARN